MNDKKLRYINPSKPKTDDSGFTGEMHKRNRFSMASKIGMWSFAFISLGFLGFAVFTLFSGAELKVYPKTEKVNLNNTFTAVYAGGDGDVYYETMKVDDFAEEVIEAEGKEEVEIKASGKIIVYNNYNTSNQKLIDNTRFESPDGLIYRIKDAVVVPGQSMKDGKLASGKLEVTVYADEPGAEYNITEPVKFTIPGLKGTDLYESFHARPKTEITGGDIGVRPIVKDSQKENVVNSLKDDLSTDLKDKISSQIPEDYIFYEGTEILTYEEKPVEITEDGKAKITVVGEVYIPLFSKIGFAQMVANEILEGYEGEGLIVKNPNELELSIIRENGNYTPYQKTPFDFSLTGEAKLVWQINETELGIEIAGKSKMSLNEILSKNNAIERAHATISPFWRQEFPQNANNIDIKIIEE